MERPVRQNWGGGQTLAPTERRTDPFAFLVNSLLMGGFVFCAVAWFLWRPLPFLDIPRGHFFEHFTFAGKTLIHAMLPHFFVADARQYQEFIGSQTYAASFGMGLRLAIAFMCACAPAFAIARTHLQPRDALMEIRGSHRFELGEGGPELATAMSAIKNAIPDFEFAPGVSYPSQIWSQHILAVGGVGAGKSTFLRPLLQRIVQSSDRLLCFDPKGEFTAGFHGPVIMAPWDSRTFAWDLAADMRNHGDMERFAAALIKDSQDPMWSNAARGILVGLLVYLQSARGTAWGWQDLADMLTLPEEDIGPLMQRYYPEAARAVAAASVTTKGILINLDSFCRPIFHLARAWGGLPKERQISFVRWTKDPEAPCRQIMLQGNGAYPELTRAYVEGIVAVIAGIVNSVELDDDPRRKIWIVADEFAQMGKIPVRPLFEVGRSRGVRCVIACQDFAQLEEVHGKDGTRALVSMCGTLMVGRIGPGETAENLSKSLGTREVERSNVSMSYDGKGGSSAPTTTLTYSRDSLALYVPAELAGRLGEKPALGGCVFAVAVQGKVYEVLWPYFNMPKVRKAHEPAPWTLGPIPKMEGQSTVRHGGGSTNVATPKGGTSIENDRLSQSAEAASMVTENDESPAHQINRTAVEVLAIPEQKEEMPDREPEGFDSGGGALELMASTDTTETAMHLAMQAVEVLKSRPGPRQSVRPSQRSNIKSRS